MEKEKLIAKMQECLKDIHPSNYAFKRLAERAVNLVCDSPNEKEYNVKVISDRDDEYFWHRDPWENGATFRNILQTIGLNVVKESVTFGGGEGGTTFSFKLAS